MTALLDRLEALCAQAALQPGYAGATLAEPYIPYVPEPWNGILVLAEAQNHGGENLRYLEWLRSRSAEDRIRRLYLGFHDGRAIKPWDDGSLPCAVFAALAAIPEECAVSNAVLWSVVSDRGTNASPGKDLIARSARLWSEMLAVLEPRVIVTAGQISTTTLRLAMGFGRDAIPLLELTSSSPLYLNRITGKVEEQELLAEHPQLALLANEHPEWLRTFRKNKLYFAADAIRRAAEMVI